MNKTFQKVVISIFILIFFLSFETRADTIVWSGNIELNTDVLFSAQQTLKILPGTIVTATGHYKIEILGNILAEGDEINPIIFTAADSTGVYDSALVAGWQGIHLIDNPTGNARFSFCHFEYGQANIPGSWHGEQGDFDHLEGNQGGAFWILDYKNISFDHCTFFYNYSRTSGGGVYCAYIQSISFSDCNFIQNKTMVWGGAIYCSIHDSLIVINSSFKKNLSCYYTTSSRTRIHSGWGSAIFNEGPGSSINRINNNTFFNNTSLSTVAIDASNSTVTNNIFTNNFNRDVLTFNMLESSHFVFNNIIANSFYDNGIPGIESISRDLHLYNNIMWNNLSDDIGEDDMVISTFWDQPDANYNLIWEGRAEGSNMITDDPLFVNPAPGFGLESNGWEYDWSLQDDSPAVNAGTPDTSGMNLPPTDLAGNPRIFGNRIDMGAYENQHVWVKINDSPAFENQIKVYPNPGTDRIMVTLPENTTNAWIELMDGTGKQVLKQRIYSNLCVFTPTHLTSGIYFYRIYNQDQVFKKGKWVKL